VDPPPTEVEDRADHLALLGFDRALLAALFD